MLLSGYMLATMFKKLGKDDEVIEGILKEFGYSWFSSMQVRIGKRDLKRLEEAGYLESSKATYSHLLIFRVKK